MLRLADVKKAYADPAGGSLPILDISDFQLGSGEQCALVGPSGSGKTTLLQVVAGITRADSGVVEIDRVNLTRLGEASRDRFRARAIGFVFQTFNLLAGFSALENVLLGMTFGAGRADPRWAEELLQRVGLGQRLHHRPGQLSVGQQQRVAVARSLANRPKLILADEPTANVDPQNQQAVLDLIRQTCQEQNVALLLVTHDPHVTSQFERVVQLEQINAALQPHKDQTSHHSTDQPQPS